MESTPSFDWEARPLTRASVGLVALTHQIARKAQRFGRFLDSASHRIGLLASPEQLHNEAWQGGRVSHHLGIPRQTSTVGTRNPNPVRAGTERRHSEQTVAAEFKGIVRCVRPPVYASSFSRVNL
jgi:hypothetical protein